MNNKNEGIFYLKNFTLKIKFIRTNRDSRGIFPFGVFCYPLQKLLLYIVGIVPETRGASLHTHVTACSRASLNSITALIRLLEATRKRSGELCSSSLLDVLGLKKVYGRFWTSKSLWTLDCQFILVCSVAEQSKLYWIIVILCHSFMTLKLNKWRLNIPVNNFLDLTVTFLNLFFMLEVSL